MVTGARQVLGACEPACRSRPGKIPLCLFALILLFVSPLTRAQTPASKEYQVKAACIYNFIQFVEWPTNAFAATNATFQIGVLGAAPFGSALDQTVQGESTRNRKIAVKYSQRADDLRDCQLVFICKSEKSLVEDILQKFAGRKVLTVSELPGFCRSGGMINFYLEGNKVRFEINRGAAQSEDLKVSSQLLSLGKVVDSKTPPSAK